MILIITKEIIDLLKIFYEKQVIAGTKVVLFRVKFE